MDKKTTILFAIIVTLGLVLLNGASALSLDNCINTNDILTVNVDFDNDEIKPGEDIKVEIEFENNDDNIDIKDLEYELWFEDSDGDKLEDDEDDIKESDEDNIDANEKWEDINYTWTPNQNFDDGDEYWIIITAKGEDKDNSSYKICAVVNQSEDSESITFERESHKLEIYKATASVLSTDDECVREIKIETSVRNIGKENENDVILKITNTALKISKSEELPKLDKRYDDDDNSLRKEYTFSVSDVDKGTYTINIEADYNKGKDKEIKSVDLEIEKCEVEEERGVAITTPTTIVPTEDVAQPTLEKEDEEEEESFDMKLVWVIVGFVVVLGIGTTLMVRFLKK